MAHREVIATRTGRYGTRMLTAGEPLTVSGPQARAMIALGRASDPPVDEPAPEPVDEKAELRAAYEEKFGKRPFMGWSPEVLREKLAES